MKVLTLNYENSKVVNFAKLRNIILENAPPVNVHNPRNIPPKIWLCSSFRAGSKEVEVVYKKLRFMDDFDSFHMVIRNLFIYLFISK